MSKNFIDDDSNELIQAAKKRIAELYETTETTPTDLKVTIESAKEKLKTILQSPK